MLIKNNGDIIFMQAGEFQGGLNCDQDVSVTLTGGYNDNFTASSGYTVISPALSISSGTVNTEYLIIQ